MHRVRIPRRDEGIPPYAIAAPAAETELVARAGAFLLQGLRHRDRLPGGKELYWDQVPLKIFADRYEVHKKKKKKEDIVEIDTFSELKAIDPAYDV